MNETIERMASPNFPGNVHFNATRYRSGQTQGHYESFFQRANHPDRPLAFWIRYTIFCPHEQPDKAIGERWAVYFDGESGKHIAAKSEVPITQCSFATDDLQASIHDSTLNDRELRGSALSPGHSIEWDLKFTGESPPLFMLPAKLYTAALPKAKSLVGYPLARFSGTLTVDGESITIDDWVGSQNHNWGSKHTDAYAWGQVAGFDNHPNTFLEVATAQIKIGPVWTPRMTLLVLRHEGHEIQLNGLGRSLLNRGNYTYDTWHFLCQNKSVHVQGTISAKHDDFVGLNYYNPPGGDKTCLNTKIARCELIMTDKTSGQTQTLTTQNRAAFEILTSNTDHGVSVLA